VLLKTPSGQLLLQPLQPSELLPGPAAALCRHLQPSVLLPPPLLLLRCAA
jgi:hypothetical protein